MPWQQEVSVISHSYVKPLKIGNLITRHNLVLAPLAGISDFPFRQICRDFGADLTFTEMVSVDGLLYQNESTTRLLRSHPQDKPLGFQIFGNDPKLFEKVLPDLNAMDPAVIDINFGCPVRKVITRGAGAALLKDLRLMEKIVASVRRSTNLPLTAKIRIGWDSQSIVAAEAAQAVESGGAQAVTVHARTRSQGYSGKASWEYIALVKSVVRIPVIGNGDVIDGPSALKMFQSTEADGIMLARGVLGRPWIFQKILNYLDGKDDNGAFSLPERFKVMENHYGLQLAEKGGSVALAQMRKHFVWYTHGMPHASAIRNQIFRAETFLQIREIFMKYLDNYGESEHLNVVKNISRSC